MIVQLMEDLRNAISFMPDEHASIATIRLLHRSLRLDVDFIGRSTSEYPQGFFQCLWNRHCRPGLESQMPSEERTHSPAMGLPSILHSWREVHRAAFSSRRCATNLSPPPGADTTPSTLFRPHPGSVFRVKYTRCGTFLLTAGENGLVKWRVVDGTIEWSHEATGVSVYDIAVSETDGVVVGAYGDGYARLHDGTSGEILAEFKHDEKLYSVDYSPKHRLLVTGSAMGTVVLWDAQEETPLFRSRSHHQTAVNRVLFLQDSTAIVSCSGDIMHRDVLMHARLHNLFTEVEHCTVCTWDWKARTEPVTLIDSNWAFSDICLLEGESRLLASTEHGTLYDFGVVSGRLENTRDLDGSIYSLSPCFKTSKIAVARGSGGVGLLDTRLNGEYFLVSVGVGDVNDVEFDPSNGEIACGLSNRTAVTLHPMRANRIQPGVNSAWVTSVDVSRCGSRIAVLRGSVISILSASQTLPTLYERDIGESDFREIVFTGSSDRLFLVRDNRCVLLWDMEEDNLHTVRTVDSEYYLERVSAVSLSPSGRYVACSYFDRAARIFDVEGMTHVCTVQNVDDKAYDVAFFGDERLFAVGHGTYVCKWRWQGRRADVEGYDTTTGDARQVAGTKRFDFRFEGGGTVLRDLNEDMEIARLPDEVFSMRCDESGTVWAGSVRSALHVYSIESM